MTRTVTCVAHFAPATAQPCHMLGCSHRGASRRRRRRQIDSALCGRRRTTARGSGRTPARCVLRGSCRVTVPHMAPADGSSRCRAAYGGRASDRYHVLAWTRRRGVLIKRKLKEKLGRCPDPALMAVPLSSTLRFVEQSQSVLPGLQPGPGRPVPHFTTPTLASARELPAGCETYHGVPGIRLKCTSLSYKCITYSTNLTN